MSTFGTLRDRARALLPWVQSPSPPPPSRPGVLDHEAYPHVMDMIFAGASREALLALRAASRAYRARADALLGVHVMLTTHRCKVFEVHSLVRGSGRVPSLSPFSPDVPRPKSDGTRGMRARATSLDGTSSLPAARTPPSAPDNWRLLARALADATVVDVDGPAIQVWTAQGTAIIDDGDEALLLLAEFLPARFDGLRRHRPLLSPCPTELTSSFALYGAPGGAGAEAHAPRAGPPTLVLLTTLTPTLVQDIFRFHELRADVDRYVVRIAYDPEDWVRRAGMRCETAPPAQDCPAEMVVILRPHEQPPLLPGAYEAAGPVGGRRYGVNEVSRLLFALYRHMATHLDPLTPNPLAGMAAADGTAPAADAYLRTTKYTIVGLETFNGAAPMRDEVRADVAAMMASTRRSGSYYRGWSDDEVRDAADAAISFLTLDEYRCAVGEEQWALETEDQIPPQFWP